MDKCNYITDKNGVTKEVQDLEAAARLNTIEQMLGYVSADCVQVNIKTSDDLDSSLATARVFITIDNEAEVELTGILTNHTKMFTCAVTTGKTFSIRISSMDGYTSPDITSYQNVVKASGVTLITLTYVNPMEGFIILRQQPANVTLYKRPFNVVEDENGNTIENGKYKRPKILEWIRKNTHRYVGTYDSTNEKMSLRQIDDDRPNYYANSNLSCVVDCTTRSTNKDVWVKFPEFWTRVVNLNENDVKIIFHVGSNPGNGWTKWGDTLIGAAPVSSTTTIDNHAHSLFEGGRKYGVISTIMDTFLTERGPGFTYTRLKDASLIRILGLAWYGHPLFFNSFGMPEEAYPLTSGRILGINDSVESNVANKDINFWGLAMLNAEVIYGTIYRYYNSEHQFVTTKKDGTTEIVIANPPTIGGRQITKYIVTNDLCLIPDQGTATPSNSRYHNLYGFGSYFAFSNSESEEGSYMIFFPYSSNNTKAGNGLSIACISTTNTSSQQNYFYRLCYEGDYEIVPAEMQ